MKLPISMGQKIKVLEFGVDLSPTPREEMVHMFNELWSDQVLFSRLKQVCANCGYELQMLLHQHEALAQAGVLGPCHSSSGINPGFC
ncbi:rCG20570 [Rattus norvegicus]|uniref:RCG20570 n=1 Tax=Rattus norvegicus TaxID=10116 RepID=A6K5N1_RAT|nr:rCG20570 [Rattus norvegicus]